MAKKIKLAKMNPELVAKEIGDFIIQEVISIGRTGGVIGLSGGVDSTTTAALAKKAFDRYNTKNPAVKLELMAYLLPSQLNKPEDTEDGKDVAERLGIRYEIIPIQPIVDAFEKTNPEETSNSYVRGNIIAEIRALILHAKAAIEHKLVLGTGNRDEDFVLAYYTLFGDGAVHLSPIGNLPKRLVREMACYLGFEDKANRTPTAGLEPGQTDFKDLGYSYDLAELINSGLKQKFRPEDLYRRKQVEELANRDIKKYEQLFGRKKFSHIEEIVEDVIRRKEIAKGKARIVNPPTPNITLEYNDKEVN